MQEKLIVLISLISFFLIYFIFTYWLIITLVCIFAKNVNDHYLILTF